MDTNEVSERDTPDTRHHGIEFGQVEGKLASHDYPTTGDELLSAYGEFKLELPGGPKTLQQVLGKRRSESGDEDIQYESGEDVCQSIYNMIGADAVGREDYSDRSGTLQNEFDEGEDRDQESL